MGEYTDLQTARRVRLQHLPHVPHQLCERRADLAMFDHERLWSVVLCGGTSRGITALEMGAILAFSGHDTSSLMCDGRTLDGYMEGKTRLAQK